MNRAQYSHYIVPELGVGGERGRRRGRERDAS